MVRHEGETYLCATSVASSCGLRSRADERQMPDRGQGAAAAVFAAAATTTQPSASAAAARKYFKYFMQVRAVEQRCRSAKL